jgi:hypothetical protein
MNVSSRTMQKSPPPDVEAQASEYPERVDEKDPDPNSTFWLAKKFLSLTWSD